MLSSTEVKKTFPRRARLLRRTDFQQLQNHSQRVFGQLLVLQYRQGPSKMAKLGITVSKKFGKAHDRNRFKRCTREAFRQLLPLFPAGLEINVLPQQQKKPFPSTQQALLDMQILLKQLCPQLYVSSPQ